MDYDVFKGFKCMDDYIAFLHSEYASAMKEAVDTMANSAFLNWQVKREAYEAALLMYRLAKIEKE